MRTLWHFGFSQPCTVPHCSLLPAQHQADPTPRTPTLRTPALPAAGVRARPHRPGSVRWLVAGALRLLVGVLLGLWAIVALAFCTAVAVSLM